MRSQIELVRDLVDLYFQQHDNAWQLHHMIQMQACMEDMNTGQQTEYLMAWLRDRGVTLNIETNEVDVVRQVA